MINYFDSIKISKFFFLFLIFLNFYCLKTQVGILDGYKLADAAIQYFELKNKFDKKEAKIIDFYKNKRKELEAQLLLLKEKKQSILKINEVLKKKELDSVGFESGMILNEIDAFILKINFIIEKYEKNYTSDYKKNLEDKANVLFKFSSDLIYRFSSALDLDLVFFDQPELILYSDKSINITDKLLAILNQQISDREKIWKTLEEKKQFYANMGIKYLEENNIKHAALKNINSYYSEYYDAHKNQIDNNTKIYLSSLLQKKPSDSYIKWISADVGYGLFAARDFAPYEFISEYTGEVIKDPIDSDYSWQYPKINNENIVVDSKYAGNCMRFVNHSSIPNCDCLYLINPDKGFFNVIYVTNKAIKENEQFLISYGLDYWFSRKFQEL